MCHHLVHGKRSEAAKLRRVLSRINIAVLFNVRSCRVIDRCRDFGETHVPTELSHIIIFIVNQ
jgi:hypothetical protein